MQVRTCLLWIQEVLRGHCRHWLELAQPSLLHYTGYWSVYCMGGGDGGYPNNTDSAPEGKHTPPSPTFRISYTTIIAFSLQYLNLPLYHALSHSISTFKEQLEFPLKIGIATKFPHWITRYIKSHPSAFKLPNHWSALAYRIALCASCSCIK